MLDSNSDPENMQIAPKDGVLLPAGAAYLAHSRRVLQNISLKEDIEREESESRAKQSAQTSKDNQDQGIGLGIQLGDEEEDEDLLSRDPKDWKNQDHYAVLGLAKYRYKATDEQIKVARM